MISNDRREWLSKELADEYRRKANQAADRSSGDIGKRRELRIELQTRCGLTDLEAVNVINGQHVMEYVDKYHRIRYGIPLNKDGNKNLMNIKALEELDRLKALVETMAAIDNDTEEDEE